MLVCDGLFLKVCTVLGKFGLYCVNLVKSS
jgi:hypothetical protein